MKNFPKISIITPSFNQGQFIEKTICSVLDQGYPNVEHIIVDGGSHDNTVEVLQRYTGRIVWCSEPDRGQAHAINKGMTQANGEIVTYLNSDDYLEPGALLHVAEVFAQHPEAHWLAGRCRIVNESGVETRQWITMYKNFWLSLNRQSVLYILNYISQPSVFWKKHAAEKVGPFNETLHFTLDYEYWLRMAVNYRLHITPQYLSSFRVYAHSKGGKAAKEQFLSEYEVSKCFTQSSILLGLHKLHTCLILLAYRFR